MLKSIKTFIVLFLIIIVNNLFFNKTTGDFVQLFQVIISVLASVFLIINVINLNDNVRSKNFFVPIWIALIMALNSTQSIVRKALLSYFPIFYEKYSNVFFVVGLALFFALIWMCKMRNRTKVA